MTRKDYEAIAKVIKDAKKARSTDSDVVYAIVNGLNKVFKADNPAFQPERFAAACEVAL